MLLFGGNTFGKGWNKWKCMEGRRPKQREPIGYFSPQNVSLVLLASRFNILLPVTYLFGRGRLTKALCLNTKELWAAFCLPTTPI